MDPFESASEERTTTSSPQATATQEPQPPRGKNRRRRRRRRPGPAGGGGGPKAPRPPAVERPPRSPLPPEFAEKTREVLKSVYGFEAFRSVQEDVIGRVLAGKDAMAIMPTGSGKSLCYQIPGLVLEGTAIILSPLIALMKDQVDALKARNVRASFINSSLTPRERGARRAAFAKGAYDILYVTPERFEDPGFVETCQNVKISLLAIDEAHCISQWGQDFRPSYRKVGEIRRMLGNPPTLALTATATKPVQRDIRKTLGVTERGMPLYHTGIERPNLYLSVKHAYGDSAKLEAIDEVVTKLHPGQPGIVYFARITDLDRIGDAFLSRKIPFERYHGKLHAYKRKIIQEKFLSGEVNLLFATNAFGMGVDKPDIRFVVHAQMPKNPESYYQEVGRAGRDGQPSTCVLLYDPDDLAIQNEFIKWANPDAEFLHRVADALATHPEDRQPLSAEEVAELIVFKGRYDFRAEYALKELEALGVAESIPPITAFEPERFVFKRAIAPGEINPRTRLRKKRRDLIQLMDMLRYTKAGECRRSFLYKYFFEKPRPQDDCRTNCDICKFGPPEEAKEKKQRKKGYQQKAKEKRERERGRRPKPPRGPRPHVPAPARPADAPGGPPGTEGVPGKKRRKRRRRKKPGGGPVPAQGQFHGPIQQGASPELRFQHPPAGGPRPEEGEAGPRRRRRRRRRRRGRGDGQAQNQNQGQGQNQNQNQPAASNGAEPRPARIDHGID